MGRRRLLAVLAGVGALAAAGCAGPGGAGGSGGDGRLTVVATTTQLADFTRNVGGGRVEVLSILKPGVDAHDFDPAPADIDAIARTPLLITNGVGLETWLDDTVEAAGFDGTLVDTSQGVPLLTGPEGTAHQHGDGGTGHSGGEDATGEGGTGHGHEDGEADHGAGADAGQSGTDRAGESAGGRAGETSGDHPEGAAEEHPEGTPGGGAEGAAEEDPEGTAGGRAGETAEEHPEGAAGGHIEGTAEDHPEGTAGGRAAGAAGEHPEEPADDQAAEPTDDQAAEPADGHTAGDATGHVEGGGDGHDHGAHDPHIWQSPRNAEIMVRNIERALAEADPAGAATYHADADAYVAQLRELDAWVQARLAPLTNRRLVTSHQTFAYYADRYDLEIVGAVIPSFDTAAELSVREITELVAKIRAAGVTAVFAETSLSPDAAETIASEAGVKVVTGADALYGDSLGPAGTEGATYLGAIRHNTESIATNLATDRA